jgi:hypothetical protein
MNHNDIRHLIIPTLPPVILQHQQCILFVLNCSYLNLSKSFRHALVMNRRNYVGGTEGANPLKVVTMGREVFCIQHQVIRRVLIDSMLCMELFGYKFNKLYPHEVFTQNKTHFFESTNQGKNCIHLLTWLHKLVAYLFVHLVCLTILLECSLFFQKT